MSPHHRKSSNELPFHYIISDDNYNYRFDHQPGAPDMAFMCTITSKNREIEAAPPLSPKMIQKLKSVTSISLESAFRKHHNLKDLWGFCECLFNHDLTRIVNTSLMFQDCGSLTDLRPLSLLSTDYLIDSSLMFSWCFRIKDLRPISSWNMTHIRNIHGMFLNCTSLHDISPLSSWNASRVKNGGLVFTNCDITRGQELIPLIDPTYR
jgi:hypothetical protein